MHQMRLNKSESRERWRQIRALWNEWDPIGVASDSLDDEYEAYLGPTLRLLERHASSEEIEQYLADVTLRHMGLSETAAGPMSRRQFATRLYDWYSEKWPNSVV